MPDKAPQPNSIPPRPREETQGRFIQILESTTDLVLMADREGRTLYVNKAGRNMLGWSTEEATERIPMEEILPQWAYAIISEQAMPTACAQGSWSGETALLSRSGREIPVLQVLLAHSGKDNEVEFFSTICRDISERKQKELEQIEWSNRYDAAIRASGQMFFDWDSGNGEINYAGAIERVTGYDQDELNGGLNQLRSLIHPDDRSTFDTVVEHAIESRDPIRSEFRLLRKDRREIALKVEGHFFLDRVGRAGRMVGFLSDITAERLFERGVQLTQERLEQSVAERTQELEQVNAELQESARQQEAVARLGHLALTGIPLEELMAAAVDVVRAGLLVDCASVNKWVPELQMFRGASDVGWPLGPAHSDTPSGILSQSGYTILVGHPVLSSNYQTESRFTPSEACRLTGIQCALTTPIQASGKPFGVLGAFSIRRREFGQEDISFLQGVANILSAAIERLRAEETAHLAQAEAETANRAKSEFLSRMSHELRTPLNAILGFTQLLEMEKHDERQAESIDHISRAGHNLLNLINEVLDIARLDSGRIKLQSEPVELESLLNEATAVTQSLASRYNIGIRIAEMPAEAPLVTGDRERLKQVFLNLLSNAVKYNRQDGSITIAIAPSGSGFLKVSITDTGFGIPADCISRLFVPFERLEQKDGATTPGTGLGLALCLRLITAMDGRIGVASTVGLGSTFWVEIPSAAPSESPSEQTPALESLNPIQKQKTILYVEDDLANYHLLERILELRKHLKLVSAIQGSMAMDLAREHKPSLILLDLNLPDMTGEVLMKKLKAEPATADIPIVIITGEMLGDRSEALLENGAAEILSKPYRIQDFFKMLDAHICN